jgi:DNA-directed RNA polymerase subunit M/transcription elongation factor TFIIS
MTSACPTCGAVLRVPDNAIGRTCKCPNCSARFVPEQSGRPGYAPVKEVSWSNESNTPQPVQQAAAVAQSAPTQECPFCGSLIPVKAKKCRECGETVDVVMRAAEEARRAAEETRREAGREGGNQQQVVIHHSGDDYRYRRRSSFPHVLHLVATIFTLGLWLPIWIIHWIIWECS